MRDPFSVLKSQDKASAWPHGDAARARTAGMLRMNALAVIAVTAAVVAAPVPVRAQVSQVSQAAREAQVAQTSVQPQASAAVPVASASRRYDIPAGALTPALNRFMLESGLIMVFDPAATQGLSTRGLSGDYSIEAGFTALLAGTGLQARREPDGRYRLSASTGQKDQAGVSKLAPVVVSGTAPDERARIFEAPGSVSVVTREDIERTGPRHASEILQGIPGVFTVTNEQNPSVSVDIRGLKDFGRVTMTIDGMRQNYQRTGHGQRNGEMFLDTEFLAGVDIEKGPTSGLGGAGSIGGVADFRSIGVEDILQEDRSIGLRVRGSHGTNGSRPSGSAVFALQPSERFDMLVGYSRKRSEAYKAGSRGTAFGYNGGFEVPVNLVQGTNQDQDSYLFKGSWHLTPAQTLRFTALGTRADFGETANQDTSYGRLAMVCGYEDPALQARYEEYCKDFVYDPDAAYPISSQKHVRNDNYALDYHYQPGNGIVDLRAKLYYVTTKLNSESLSSEESAAYSSSTRTNTWGGLINNTSFVPLGDKTFMVLNVGGEAFFDRTRPSAQSTTLTGEELALAAGTTPEGKRMMASLFTSASFHYNDWLSITPGLRYDYYRLWGDASGIITRYRDENNVSRIIWGLSSIDVDRRMNKVLPTLNLAVKPVPQVRLFAGAGKGWRLPSITESITYGSPPGHGEYGGNIYTWPNWMLEPEKTRSWEVGVGLDFSDVLASGDRLRARLAQFSNRTENFMHLRVFAPPGATGNTIGYYTYANAIDPVSYYGQELEADYDAGVWYGILRYAHIKRRGAVRSCDFVLGGPDLGGACSYRPEQNSTNVLGIYYDATPPRNMVSLDLGTRLMEQRLNLGAKLTCASKTGNPTTTEREGLEAAEEFGGARSYCVTDLYGSYRIDKTWKVGFNLKNLTDREYAQPMADDMVRTYAPGRTFMGWFQADF